jgi:hypothetical protein
VSTTRKRICGRSPPYMPWWLHGASMPAGPIDAGADDDDDDDGDRLCVGGVMDIGKEDSLLSNKKSLFWSLMYDYLCRCHADFVLVLRVFITCLCYVFQN